MSLGCSRHLPKESSWDILVYDNVCFRVERGFAPSASSTEYDVASILNQCWDVGLSHLRLEVMYRYGCMYYMDFCAFSG